MEQRKKYKVQWEDEDCCKRKYTTHIFTDSKGEAEILLRAAILQGAKQGKVIKFS